MHFPGRLVTIFPPGHTDYPNIGLPDQAERNFLNGSENEPLRPKGQHKSPGEPGLFDDWHQ